ncbi:MAG: SDR family oxidoreductase [Gemmatimonadetes bacterium]|nr:SDR family oxidoreductase [Gemmatimonadota bacterium]
MITLAGRSVLVTGGSRGIGKAVALLAAKAGADVAITYRSRAGDAEAVARQIRDLGRRAYIGGGDHADPAVVGRIFREVKAVFGGLDGFVANAGVWPPAEVALRDMAERQWRGTMMQNVDGVFHTTKASLELLRPGGAIVLVSSTAGQRGEPFHADYAASKGALISLTKALCVECAPGIRVNCVAPGWVDTEMVASALEGSERDRVTAGIPLGRIPPPEDIAGPIVFLLSAWARHITGEVLNVNGGSVLCG